MKTPRRSSDLSQRYELVPSLETKQHRWYYSRCDGCNTRRPMLRAMAHLARALNRSPGKCECGGKLRVEIVEG